MTMYASGKETSNNQLYVYPGKRPSTNGTNYVILQLFYIYSTAYSPIKLVLNRNRMGKQLKSEEKWKWIHQSFSTCEVCSAGIPEVGHTVV